MTVQKFIKNYWIFIVAAALIGIFIYQKTVFKVDIPQPVIVRMIKTGPPFYLSRAENDTSVIIIPVNKFVGARVMVIDSASYCRGSVLTYYMTEAAVKAVQNNTNEFKRIKKED